MSLYVAVEYGRSKRQRVAANAWPCPVTAGQTGRTAGWDSSGVGPEKLERLRMLHRGQLVSSLDLMLECCGLPVD